MQGLLNRALAVIDGCIAPSLRQPNEPLVVLRMLAAINLISLLNVVIAATLTSTMPSLSANASLSSIAGWCYLISATSSFAALLTLRFTTQTILARQLTVLAFFMPILITASVTGGAMSPIVHLMLILPIAGGLLFGWRLGAGWLLVVSFTVLALWALPQAGLLLPNIIPAGDMEVIRWLAILFHIIVVAMVLVVYSFVHFHEVAELSNQRAEYMRLARQDQLTHLPNRLHFTQAMTAALQEAKRLHHKVGLLVLDLDGFKDINDTHGHAVGDEVLSAIGQRLDNNIRDGDFAARLGGDEFVAVFYDVKSSAVLADKAASLMAKLNAPVETEAVGVLRVGVSVGAALYPDDGDDQKALFDWADGQMYQAKRLGSGLEMASANDGAEQPYKKTVA